MKKRGEKKWFNAEWWRNEKARTVKDKGNLEAALRKYQETTKDLDEGACTKEQHDAAIAALKVVEKAAETTLDECGTLGKLVGNNTRKFLEQYPEEIKKERDWLNELSWADEVEKVNRAVAKKEAKIEAMNNKLAGELEAMQSDVWYAGDELAKTTAELIMLRHAYAKKSEIYRKEEQVIDKMRLLVKKAEEGLADSDLTNEDDPKVQRFRETLASVRAATDKLYDGPGKELEEIQDKINALDPKAAKERRRLNDYVLEHGELPADSPIGKIIEANYAQLMELTREDN
jgi:hypothetical protein